MTPTESNAEAQRRRAGEIAAAEIEAGMKVGLGTGRSAEQFVRALGARVKDGLKIVGVPTSERTRVLAGELGIPLSTLEETPELDVVVDGADEIDPDLRLIKGGGGALLREKIVASAAKRMIVVAEGAKVVLVLGAFPLPIEVIPFGMSVTLAAIKRLAADLGLSGEIRLRQSEGKPFVTDSGNHIFDASFGQIPDADTLAGDLNRIPGVVEHGLFIGFPVTAIVAHNDGVEWLNPSDTSRMERNDHVHVR